MKSIRAAAFAAFLVFAIFPAAGQANGDTGGNKPVAAAAAIKPFRDYRLGMSLDEVKDRLLKDPYFNYRGEPDVSFLPVKEQVLIECSGNAYIRRAHFQFVDKKLFTLILDLEESRVDYFTMMTALQNAYGAYRDFSPQQVVWEAGGVRLSLEKPLTVKYIDLAVFQRLKDAGRKQETDEGKALKDFLSGSQLRSDRSRSGSSKDTKITKMKKHTKEEKKRMR